MVIAVCHVVEESGQDMQSSLSKHSLGENPVQATLVQQSPHHVALTHVKVRRRVLHEVLMCSVDAKFLPTFYD